MGLGAVQVYVSPQLGRSCMPGTSSPPTIVIGEALLSSASDAPPRLFLLMRALKLVKARASALVRTPAAELALLVAAWLKAFNPSWNPDGFNANALAEAGRRLQAGLPRDLGPDIGVMALEAAGSLGTQGAALGASAITWANRAALLAIGDPAAALEGIALSLGKDAPADFEARAQWVARTVEVKDLVQFSVTDAYAEARGRLGLEKPPLPTK
jgi:hypothetical protein